MNNKRLLSVCLLSIALLLSGCGGVNIETNNESDPASVSAQTTESSSAASESTTAASSATSQTEQTTAMTETSADTSSQAESSQSLPSETSSEKQSSDTTAQTSAATSATPKSTSVQTSQTVSEQTNIAAAINSIFASVKNSGAKYCVKVISLNDNEIIEAGSCNTQMVSASLIKLYVAGTVFEQMDKLTAAQSYNGETEQLVMNMISYSDNNACNTLVRKLGSGDAKAGMREVNRFCANHGYANTSMSRLMLDFNGLENYTTATDCCNFLKSVYNNELKGSQKIIDYMKRQHTRTKIPMGITDGTVVANKTGELAAVENDSAIVYASTGVYVICAMTCGLTDTASARNAIILCASAVHKHRLKKAI